MQLPAGSTLYDLSSGQRKFALTGHTSAVPKMVIIDRRDPNGSVSGFMKIRVIHGKTQADGTVKNSTVALEMRYAAGTVLADVQAVNNALRSILASTNFDSDVGVTLSLPNAGDVAA